MQVLFSWLLVLYIRKFSKFAFKHANLYWLISKFISIYNYILAHCYKISSQKHSIKYGQIIHQISFVVLLDTRTKSYRIHNATVLVYCRTLTCFLWAVMYSEGIHNCQSSVSLVPSQLLSAALPCSLTTLVTFCGEINVLHSKQESCSDQQKCKIISSIYLHTSIVSYTPGMTGWFFFAINDTTSSISDSTINLRLESTFCLCRL